MIIRFSSNNSKLTANTVALTSESFNGMPLTLRANNSTTTQKPVGSQYWNNDAQTFYMYTVNIPVDATGFKVHKGSRWFGSDGNALTQNTVYIFNYSGDKALYEYVEQPLFAGHSLSLGGDIGIYFYLNLTAEQAQKNGFFKNVSAVGNRNRIII